jgi:hypothetical protein
MDWTGKMKRVAIAILFLLALGNFAATEVQGATCEEGTATPPFLGVETVPPNLMLMIDNSGSMYDLNYVENIGYCFDDSYDNSFTYAGYFMTVRQIIDNTEVWYTYSGADKEYVPTTKDLVYDATQPVYCKDDPASDIYRYEAVDTASGNEFLCVSINEPVRDDPSTHRVLYYAATGKFLNWMTTSKMDVQKQVLTGGKWGNHPLNPTKQMIPESRGCLGKRTIKEVNDTSGKNLVNGGAAVLTFAIRNDDDDMDSDGNYNNTVIDIHAASTDGFNNTACQEVLTALQSPTGVGGVKTPLKECLGGFEENKTPEGDMISAFNLSIQDCWYMAKFGVDDWRNTFNSAAIRNQCDTLYEGNGFYAGRNPWDIPTDVSALVCRGDYANTIEYNFVGRCYIPAGHPPAGFPYNEDEDAQEFLVAGSPIEQETTQGAGVLPDWGQTGINPFGEYDAPESVSFMGVKAEEEPAGLVPRENDEPQPSASPAGLNEERNTLAEAVKEFINSGGRNQQARLKVLNAFYSLFVAEANAAGGIVEEGQASCTGTGWTVTAGASGGNSVYSEINGDTCTFPPDGSTYTHGLYEVYVIAPCEGPPGNRNIETEFTVNHDGVDPPVSFNHDQKDNCGSWVKIPGPEENGTFEFLKGGGSVVVNSNSLISKKSYADAVQFAIYKEIPPPPPPPMPGAHPYVMEIVPLTLSPTDETTVSFKVTFSQGVANFNDANDVIVTEIGLPGPLTHTGVEITPLAPADPGDPGPRIYQVDITGISGAGDIILSVNSWVRDWTENSAVGTYDEHNAFYITGPFPAQVRFGKYALTVGPTTADAAMTNLSVGYSTPVQDRSGLIDYPADITCCSGLPTDYCCVGSWPLGWDPINGTQYTHFLTGWGFSDGGMGVDWQVGDTISFSIVPGSDINSWGQIVTFTERSAPITRVEPIPDTCVGAPPAGPAWWCDSCIEEAIIDFCGFLSSPDVPDPSDQSSIASTGEYWNIPALLWDGAINGQLDDKIGTMSAKVRSPRRIGLIHIYADDIRFGVMGFYPQSGSGVKSECGDYGLFTNCAYDGAQVAVPVDDGDAAHTAAVAEAINDYDGETWTPLAESMYTAVGYFTQKESMRLNSVNDYAVNADAATDTDFTDYAGGTTWQPGGGPYAANQIVIHDGVYYQTPGGGTSFADATSPLDDEGILDWEVVNDPIFAYCQRNFVLVITEGSSTADLNSTVATFAAAKGDTDTDTEGCDVLRGSTYFDDMVEYAWNENDAADFYQYEQFAEDKNHIEVHIVDTRGAKSGTGECDPGTLLANAAENTNRVDKNADGIAAETETALYTASSPRELWNAIDLVMRNIITQTSSGSAASVISASRSGEGALYQALFWPSTLTELPPPYPVYADWLGEVHAFFVDGSGNLREDSNKDGLLDETNDEIVVIYWDEIEEKTKACNGSVTDGICTGVSKDLPAVNYLWNTTEWLNSPTMDSNIIYNRGVDGATGEFVFDPAAPKRYIFTWNDLDNDGAVEDAEILQFQRGFDPDDNLDSSFSANAVVTAADRGPIYFDFGLHPDGEDVDGSTALTSTCEDLDADGILDEGEDVDVDGELDTGEDVDCDGNLDTWEDMANNIIDWVRGNTIYGMRKRDVRYDLDKNPATGVGGKEKITWRLGDVVHSTPLSVAGPAENYHQLYRDFSYAEFLVHYQDRRHVIYFGANDGMLHAVNGGFFKEFDDPNDPNPDQKIHRFCRTQACEIDPNTNLETGAALASAPVLGAEMWAYVPYNIMPHLQCLTDVVYDHKYFVDLRPRIFDVQIFNDDADHPNGWGTILVGGMRFGGSKVRPGGYDEDGILQNDYDGNGVPDAADNREFTSAYFILDITNPEKPPKLLAEFTRTIEDLNGDDIVDEGGADASPEVELGYTTNISTMVPMRIDEDLNDNGVDDGGENQNCNGDLDDFSKWYLILGSGPTEIDGTSSQYGNVSVVPLDRFVDTDGAGADTVLDMRIPADTPFGDDPLPAGKDAADVDFGSFELLEDQSFTGDLITVDMETNSDYMADSVYFGTNTGDWATGWGGSLYRLVVRKWQECNDRLIQIESKPREWAALYEPNTTPFKPLIDVEQPITTSPTVGTDGLDFWVYFGTGRFFDPEDKTNDYSNSVQSFYGIREPVSNNFTDLFYTGVLPQPTDGDGNPPCQLSWAQVLNDRLGTPNGGKQSDGTTDLTGRGGLGLMGVHNIEILSAEYLDQPGTLKCVDDPDEVDPLYCLPAELREKRDNNGDLMLDPDGDPYTASYKDFILYLTGDYIVCNGTEHGYDGWYRDFPDPRERNLGQASLLGGLLTFNTYQPFTRDLCQTEGLGYLYGLYYQTGTAWYEDVFGEIDADADPRQENPIRMELGKGLSTTPNIHVGKEEGGKAFVQTSVGKIKEIPQPNMPDKTIKSGRVKWRDIEE